MSEAKVPAKWDEEADVVVVGYGAAGAATAITAHDAGAEVLLLEKAPEEGKGGNSRVSGNLVFWPDDVEKAKTYFKALTGEYTDDISEEMIDVWAKEMHANRAWLEGLGLDFAEFPKHTGVTFPELAGSDCVHVLMHGEGPLGGERLWKGVVEPAVTARNIRTLYETGAVKLVKDKGEIVGVIADQRGKRIAIKAKRGVVLTCGGFENNPKMVRNYLEGLSHLYPFGTPYNTGDGIRMGIEVGADLWHMSNLVGPFFFFKAPELPVANFVNMPHANSYLFVARDGKRFMTEGPASSMVAGANRIGKTNYHGVWIKHPAPTPIHLIFDETLRRTGPIGQANADWDVSHGNLYNWSDDNLREVDKGWIKKADTLSELAGLINLPPDVLQVTVARFNTLAKNGNDVDFNRRPDRIAPLQTPPYYAMELAPTLANTEGGPRRNKDAQIVDTDGDPIPRLYSAGELGSIYGYLYQDGGMLGECFAFGRIAGRNVAQEKPQ